MTNRNTGNAYTPKLAENYSRLREKFDETNRDLFSALEDVGVKAKEVLDLGCGDGRYSMLLQQMGARHVTGLDVSPKMVDLAKEKRREHINVDFIVADGMQVPLKCESVELIVSNFVIHYFSDSKTLFKELSRVLKPNGSFVSTFNISDVSEGFEYLYNTSMPIQLGHGTESVIVQNLLKSRIEVHRSLKDAGLITKVEKELSHPNARIDDSYCEKEHVHKHAILLVVQKQDNSTQ